MLTLLDKITENIAVNQAHANDYKPSFFRIDTEAGSASLANLLNADGGIRICDTMYSQLTDLVKSKKPAQKLSKEEIKHDIENHLAGRDINTYGVWVYYPWVNKLVHLLDEDEFVSLRTNRNKYKITDEEEVLLSQKKVGVVGLSVGQSVSLTMAMERIFGELRIADFDELELTNLNRIRSAAYNMGLKKAVVVAREIAEIDPYLKVTVFTDGLTQHNIHDFFTVGGQLDLVIDECDGLDIKILLRHKAKSLGVPVVMEASDRGVLDVERFDREPDRPILHGFIDHLDHSKIGSLTNEEKIPFILPMLGVDTISNRLKASMVEVEQSINTWPQLASAVVLGGAICADVTRRILLGYYNESGRYFVDIEQLVGDKQPAMEGSYDVVEMHYPDLTLDKMIALADEAIAAISVTGVALGDDIKSQIVEAAIWAPSAGNNQPWKWISRHNGLFLYHDKKQSYSWTDEQDFIAQISLGTSIENASVKAAAIGYKANVHLYPLGADAQLAACLYFSVAETPAFEAAMAPLIGTRCSNRKLGDRSVIDQALLSGLESAASAVPFATLNFLTEPALIAQLAEVEAAAERARFLHPQSHSEFFGKELKWNPTGNEIITEGLDIKTLELSLGNETGLKVAAEPKVIALLNKWGQGKTFEKMNRKAINASSAVGLVTMPHYAPEHFIAGGRAAERAWLQASAYNLAVHPISAPLFLHARMMYGGPDAMEPNMREEIGLLYDKLCILFPELIQRQGIFMFRLFRSDKPTARSLRKPLGELYNIT